MVSLAIGAAGSGVLLSKTRHHDVLTVAPAEQATECAGNGEPCGHQGQRGECVQQRCLLGSGRCTQDIDCDDDNVCTSERCDHGRCVQQKSLGGCKLTLGGVGQCLGGFCEPTDKVNCSSDRDCPAASNPCGTFTCQDGTCTRGQKPDGDTCETAAGRKGACATGTCAPMATGQEERCRIAFDEDVGYYRRCAKTLAVNLPPEKLREIESKIATSINESYRYDVKVSLVEQADGGYNVVVYNRRPHTDLRGVCDPSFIAWQVADATTNSNWKSRQLHIWLKPYLEGWGLSTRGSREAVRHGRSGSVLGWAGVLDAPSFRKWLEKEFRPLVSVPMGLREPTPAQQVAAAVPPPATLATSAPLSPMKPSPSPVRRAEKPRRHRADPDEEDESAGEHQKPADDKTAGDSDTL